MSKNKKYNSLLISFIVKLTILTIIQLCVSFVKQDFLWIKEVYETEEGRIGILVVYFFVFFASFCTSVSIKDECNK